MTRPVTTTVSSRVGAAVTLRRVGALLGTLVLLGVGAVVLPVPASAAVGSGDVSMSILDVNPNSPRIDYSPHPLAISLRLTNTTGQTLKDVTVSAERGDPIASQSALNAAIAKPQKPSASLVSPLDTTVKATLAPHASVDVVYRTRTDITTDTELCLCANAIYPLWFTADYTDASSGATTTLATAQTYLPSFIKQPARTRVAWVWPLLDRPHRLRSDTVFTDDDLATEINPGGRLDQLLSVVEQVSAQGVPLTLVTDPELIDELQVMATGYKVSTHGVVTIGTQGTAAAQWLQRLRTVLDRKNMEVAFTPFADPAVESLTRSGLSWSVGLGTQAQARVTQALGGSRTPLTDIAWPAGGGVTTPTLDKLVSQGTNTVIVTDKALPKGSGASVVPDAIAPLQATSGQVIAAVTSTPVERLISQVLSPGAKGLGALPQLVAQLAVRAETSMDRSHFVVLTPPRDLTIASTAIAVRTILATADSTWSTPLPLRTAASTIDPVDHGTLHRLSAPQLPTTAVRSLRYVTDSLPALMDLYYYPADAKTRLGTMAEAIQRCESSALLDQPGISTTNAGQLSGVVTLIRRGVTLVPPSEGTYTLTSKNSKLPVTVINSLPDRIRIRIGVTTSVPGLTAAGKTQTLDPGEKVQEHVEIHVDRVGRFPDVHVTITTVDGLSLGTPIRPLTVRSTALGTIGIVITVVAAIVLGLALVVRFTRRLARRRKPRAA